MTESAAIPPAISFSKHHVSRFPPAISFSKHADSEQADSASDTTLQACQIPSRLIPLQHADSMQADSEQADSAGGIVLQAC